MLKALDPSRQIIFQKDWTDFCYCGLLCARILGTDMAFWGKTSSHLWLGWNRYTFGELLHTASFKLCWQCLAIWWLARRFMLLSLSPGSSCLQSVLHIVARLTLLEASPAACRLPLPYSEMKRFSFPSLIKSRLFSRALETLHNKDPPPSHSSRSSAPPSGILVSFRLSLRSCSSASPFCLGLPAPGSPLLPSA